MPLNGLASVHLLGTLPGGQQVANTFHIDNPGLGSPPDPADLVTLAGDLNTYLTTTWKAMIPTTGTVDAIKVAQVPNPNVAGDAYADYILPVNVAGTHTLVNEQAPNEACICLSLKTNSGQRSYRGHLLMPPGLNARDLNGEQWSTAGNYFTSANAFRQKLQDGCSGSHVWTGTKLPSYNLVIYSRTLELRSLPSVTGVISVVCNSRVHWLRSRARGTT